MPFYPAAPTVTGLSEWNDDFWPLSGLKGWNYDPVAIVDGGAVVPTSGYMFLGKVPVPKDVTIAQVGVMTAAAGVTNANCFFAVYKSDGTRIAVSADRSTALRVASNFVVSSTLTVDGGQSLSIIGGDSVYVWAGLVVGTQGSLTLARGGNTLPTLEAALGAGRCARAGTGVYAAAPATLPSLGYGNHSSWFAVL